MRIYRSEEWASIPWINTDEGRRQRAYLEPLLKKGVSAHIQNVRAKLFIFHIDHLLIPFTVGERGYKDSYVTSMYSLLLYAEEEMKRHQHHLLKILLFPFLTLLKGWLRISKINHAIIVNNHLLSTNLYPSLTFLQVKKIKEELQKYFPSHSIIFRSLNCSIENDLTSSLSRLGGHLITSRSIYLFDPRNYEQLPSKKRWIIEKDKKLIKKNSLEILQHEDFQVGDAKRIKFLYDQLYLKKYSKFNPSFTEEFFENAILNRTFVLSGIRHKEELVGVIGFFKEKEILATPIVGYDIQLPKELGLYRVLTAQILEKSIQMKSTFHMSSGVGHFKRQRGAIQELEYMAVFFSHLSLGRRIFWRTLGVVLNHIGGPLLKKYKL